MDNFQGIGVLYESLCCNWKHLLAAGTAGPRGALPEVTKSSHVLTIRHVLKYFLHDKHLSLGLK